MLTILLNHEEAVPLYQQIYLGIRSEIEQGSLLMKNCLLSVVLPYTYRLAPLRYRLHMISWLQRAI